MYPEVKDQLIQLLDKDNYLYRITALQAIVDLKEIIFNSDL